MKRKLVSVILPFFNGLKYTKMCLNSVLEYTRHPYELILIDNGSKKEIKEYFKTQACRFANVKIISNRKNLGAPKAFNQGIAASAGEYLLFLNNDTIVTDGWLNRLVGHIERDSKIGIVGASTNGVKNDCGDFPTYKGYRNEKEIQRTAAFVSLARKGEFEVVPAVTSFCMLTKREVIDKIGVFDENYGLGTNDDHDFCLRAREAGYKIICDFDTLVFHFYNRTLGNLNIKELDRRNREYFVWKFGERGLKFYEEVKQPYGTRGERPFKKIKKMKIFS